MTLKNTAGRERVNLRISEAAKRRIERAAAVEGKTVSGFIVSSAMEHAEKAIERHETMALGREDAMRFFEAVANPPAPNDKLRAAMDEHRWRVDSR